ncbi:hypothetical protein KCG44_09980 [Pacificimonas sp. WHA3]|uniref:TIGR03016 family PEP-CTERM system-associated outer membrane protein n=1 Tax=Pacificimonas pallii TaxID=2827236 RepID=A0ABS6SFC6_9SPHN|nr:hypothetical protein [Pacificimonas pallii]MBV7257109.1 hypothetical protein [Pacificimonas pallii]
MVMVHNLKIRRVATSAAIVSLVAATSGQAQVNLSGSAVVRQVFTDTTGGASPTSGWLETGLSGLANIETRRVNGAVAATVTRRFEQWGRVNRSYRVNADGELTGTLIPRNLFLTVGGRASQYQRDSRGFVGSNPDADNGNTAQVFAVYAEPSVRTSLGAGMDASATYRIGKTTVDGVRSSALLLNGDIGLDGNSSGARGLSDSLSQSATISAGLTPGRQRFGLRVVGRWTKEEIDELDQRYRSYSVSGQGTYQASRKLSFTIEGGYEDILNRQQSILFDPVTNLPLVGPDGEFLPDPVNPRRTAFDRSGAFGTVGFRYAPSRRANFSLQVGYRYGDPNINASMTFEPMPKVVVTGRYNEGLSSFGRLLTQSIDGEVVSVQRTNQTTGFGECTLGRDPVTGGCLGNLTQSLVPATFRSRRGSVGVIYDAGQMTFGANLFYNERGYVDLQQLQVAGDADVTAQSFSNDDTSYGISGIVTYKPGARQTFTISGSYSRNAFALSENRTDDLIAGSISYKRDLGNSLALVSRAGAALRSSDDGFSRDSKNYSASLGLTYSF